MKKQTVRNSILGTAGGVVLLMAGCAGGMTAAGGPPTVETKTVTKEVPVPGPTKTVEVEVPGPVQTKTKEVKVEVPVTPGACLTAIELADEALTLAGDAVQATYEQDPVWLDQITVELEGKVTKYHQNKAACYEMSPGGGGL